MFHQANGYMLQHLQQKCELPADRFFIGMRDCGNTVSSSIPIALAQASNEKRIKPGDTVVVIGFGVGYSWAGTVIRWAGCARSEGTVASTKLQNGYHP